MSLLWKPTFLNPAFSNLEEALKEATHFAVGAHPDDLEILAGHGISECYQNPRQHFVGVVCTTGSGSPQADKTMSAMELSELRSREQQNAAKKGEYAALVGLRLESAELKGPLNRSLVEGLKDILGVMKPQVIYTHDLADPHGTHLAVTLHLIQALRESSHRPQSFYGCEVWRSLGWLDHPHKCLLPVSRSQLISELISCHQSQLKVKSYHLATLGRMQANATYDNAYGKNDFDFMIAAMDLLPLLADDQLLPESYLEFLLTSFLDKSLRGLYSLGKRSV